MLHSWCVNIDLGWNPDDYRQNNMFSLFEVHYYIKWNSSVFSDLFKDHDVWIFLFCIFLVSIQGLLSA